MTESCKRGRLGIFDKKGPSPFTFPISSEGEAVLLHLKDVHFDMLTICKRNVEIGQIQVNDFWKPPLKISDCSGVPQKSTSNKIWQIGIQAFQQFHYLSADGQWCFCWRCDGMGMHTTAYNENSGTRMTVLFKPFKTMKFTLAMKIFHLCKYKLSVGVPMFTCCQHA